MSTPESVISLQRVSKGFRKSELRREHSSMKTELVRWFRGERGATQPSAWIDVLRNVDLSISRGTTVGLVGRNGSGKSTLLKLITGIYSPTSGTVNVRGRVSALLDLGAGFHPDFTGRENIFINGIILGMSRSEIRSRLESIIEFSELGEFIDQRVRTYSSGMFMRLAFSVATHVDPEILIIDEILAVGDEHFRRKSAARLKEFKESGRTILVVTHDLSTVESWCDAAVWIDGGTVREIGPPVGVVSRYKEALGMAEVQQQEGAASALDAPGLALPPVAPYGMSATDRRATVYRVQAFRQDGTPEPEIGPEEPFSIGVEFQASAGEHLLTVRLLDSSGNVLFESSLRAAQAGGGTPSQLAWLRLDRCGLANGDYRLEAIISANGNTLARIRSDRPLRVRAEGGGGQGVIRLPHRWTIEGSAAGSEVA